MKTCLLVCLFLALGARVGAVALRQAKGPATGHGKESAAEAVAAAKELENFLAQQPGAVANATRACASAGSMDDLSDDCLLSLHVMLRNRAHERGLLPANGYPKARWPAGDPERVHIQRFLEAERGRVKQGSRCVEFDDLSYTNMFFMSECKSKHYFKNFDEKTMRDMNSGVKQSLDSEVLLADIDQGLGQVPPESMDVIICTNVFEHVQKPLQAMKHLYEMTKPGGVILFTVPSQYPYHGYDLSPGQTNADGSLRDGESAVMPYGNYFLYTFEGVKHTMRQAGFSVADMKCWGDSWTLATKSEGLSFDTIPVKAANAEDCTNPSCIFAVGVKPLKGADAR